MTQSGRRQINPARLRAALTDRQVSVRLAADAAGMTSIAVRRWINESKGPVRSFDLYRFRGMCRKLNIAFDDVTEPYTLPERRVGRPRHPANEQASA
jgi:hypothetical protein